jgi:hypothetical protein
MLERMRSLRTPIALLALLAATAGARSAAAQSLSATTMGLFPRESGQIAYADLRSLRQSPHYAKLHTQVLPERLRQLEQFAGALGIDFETQAQQLSWAVVPGGAEGVVDLLSIAEGNFAPATVLERAKAGKLATREVGGLTLISVGKNDGGQMFVLTFTDPATLVFGSEAGVEALLKRRAEGQLTTFGNPLFPSLIKEVNGKRPVWTVMDRRFAALAIKQMAPSFAGRPEMDVILGNLNAAVATMSLTKDLAAESDLLCKGAVEAQLFAAVVQGALSLAAIQAANSSPELAQALRSPSIAVNNDRVEVKLNLQENQVTALLASNNLQLKF